MEYFRTVVSNFCLVTLLIGMVVSTNEVIYTTHENGSERLYLTASEWGADRKQTEIIMCHRFSVLVVVSIGRSMNTSMCDVFALTQDQKIFHIISDGPHIDPSCALYLIGVHQINNIYSFSGMCFKMYDIALPCGRNDTIIIRGWAVDILNKTQSLSLYTNQSMLVTEKTLRCENKQDFSMNYEFCWEKISMLEILFYSPYKRSSVLPTITVHTRALIGSTFPPLSLDAMDTMTIQMSKCSCDDPNCRTCKPTAHDMYIEFLDRVITIGSNNNNNKIEEKTSSASVDLNILLPSLFGSIATVVVAVIGAWKCNNVIKKRNDMAAGKREKNGNEESQNTGDANETQDELLDRKERN